MRDDGLIRLSCTECGGNFLVAEAKGVNQCALCKIHALSDGIIIPYDEYIKESMEWY